MNRERVTVREVTWPEMRGAVLSVRHTVFVLGQGVPADLDDDGSDAGCWHVLAEADGGQPVGTARVDRQGRVGRVAVLETLRRRGVGTQLMDAIDAIALRENLPALHLHAQLHSVPFYQQLGFVAEGPKFDEAGIPHVAMRR